MPGNAAAWLLRALPVPNGLELPADGRLASASLGTTDGRGAAAWLVPERGRSMQGPQRGLDASLLPLDVRRLSGWEMLGSDTSPARQTVRQHKAC